MPYSTIEARHISELCTVVDCEHKTAPYVDSSEYLVVRTSNVRNGQLLFDDMKFTTKEAYNDWTKRAIPKFGDVLFTREAPAGESCLVPNDKKVCMGQRMVMLRPKREVTDPIFFSYILNTERTKADILRLSIGSTVSRINIADIKKLKVASPPLPKQRKIAKILSTWDKAISTTERLIDNSKQQKKALMQQLLTGKKRLLDDSGKPFEGEWEQVVFGDVVKISSRKYNPVKAAQCLPCIELEHIEQESGRIIGSANASDLASIKTQFSAGSVIFGKLRPYLRKFARPNFDGVCSTEIWVFETKSKLLDEYLFHFVQMDKFISEANKSAGSKMPRADWGVVSELVVKIPCLAEQRKIANVLSKLDKNIELLQQQLADLKKEKKALMQQLLTGKRRVKVEEKEVA